MNGLRTMPTLRRMRPMLGTFVEIGIFSPDARAPEAVVAAFEEVERAHRLMSFQSRDSELTHLNLAGGRRVALSHLTLRALRLARTMTQASGGLFNCTVAGALIARGRLPDHDGRECLAAGTADDLVIDAGGALLKRAVRVTLDGIAKGLAVDRALARLRHAGVRDAWVNAGGDLRVVGRHGLPVQLRGAAGGFLLQSGALATSANSPTYDPSSPGEICATSGRVPAGEWSVLAPCAWRADALTKVAALAPASERAGLIRRLGGQFVEWRAERGQASAA
jgi:thiamine biosynthesis lipoprotein